MIYPISFQRFSLRRDKFKYLFKYKLVYIDDVSRWCHRALEHFGLKPDSTPPQLKDISCMLTQLVLVCSFLSKCLNKPNHLSTYFLYVWIHDWPYSFFAAIAGIIITVISERWQLSTNLWHFVLLFQCKKCATSPHITSLPRGGG